MNTNSLQPSERIIFALRALYNQYGYSRYKMNKFEEYDLYAYNKDFLISEEVITFTDTNGRLMALKPDVTLSIVKNTKDTPGAVQKLYYNENVYRVSKGSRSFKEIMQVGLEAIGEIDDYRVCEVMQLALDSLGCTEKNCILEISHLGLLSELLEYVGIPAEEKKRVLGCIGEKNTHELTAICKELQIPDEKLTLLRTVISLHGTPDEILPKLGALLGEAVQSETLAQFTRVIGALNTDRNRDLLRVDFSVISDLRYYNGFVFKGFAEGLPSSVLSGGQYDTLMKRMKRSSGAIGFAVYLDLLEQLGAAAPEYDTDVLLTYDETCELSAVLQQANGITAQGEGVSVQRNAAPGLTCRRMIRMKNGEVETIEYHA